MKILKHLYMSLSVGVFAACCGLFVLFSVSGTGWQALSVPTGSMSPSMPPGSLALVHRVPTASLKVGDIITYVNPLNSKATISHRIVKKFIISGRIPGFITKGDANKSADIPIAAGSVQGRVVWHLPHVGNWLIGSKSWFAISLLVYLPALFIMIDEMRRLAAYYKLAIPYKLYGFQPLALVPKKSHHYAAGAAALVAVAVIGAAALGSHASALLSSNVVTLGPNHISSAATTPPPTNTCTNNNSVNVNNTSTQTAQTGTATSTNNTNGGTATSGDASNTNSSSTTVTINNGC